MRRYGVALAPRARGYSECIFREQRRGRATSGRPKNNERKLSMKSWKIIFTTALSALVCFGLLPEANAVEPAAPDTALAGGNTADGQLALASLSGGFYNSAFGVYSLLSLTDASFDTGIGAGALLSDNGGTNTAVGAGALFSNTTGSANNAVGAFALFTNDSGTFDNAHGRDALLNNLDGSE